MRVLFFTQSFLPHIGGSEIALHRVAEGLSERGVECAVLHRRQRVGKPEHPRHYETFEFCSLPDHTLIDFRRPWFSRALRNCVKRWRPDIVHAWCTWLPGFCATSCKTKIGVPVVITGQGIDIQVEPKVDYGYRLNMQIDKEIRWAVAQADGLVAISEDMVRAFTECGGSSDRIRLIPNPSLGTFGDLPSSLEARRTLGVPEHANVLLLVGRNHPKKQFEIFLRSFLKICGNFPEFHLIFVGRGCRALVTCSGEDSFEAIHLFEDAMPLGLSCPDAAPESRLETYFAAADAFVMPSAVEGSPLALIEALEFGLPVVTSPDARLDFVQLGREGPILLCDPESPKSVWAALEKLRDPVFCDKQRKKAKELSKSFSAREVARKHQLMYESCLNGGI